MEVERPLLPKVRELLEGAGSGETPEHLLERRRYIKSDRFVSYALAEQHMERLQELLEAPKTARPDNLVLVGETNSGKTGLLSHFIDTRAAPVDDPNEPAARVPAIYVLMRGDVDEDRIYHWILERLFAPYKEKDRQDKKFRMIAELFERLSVQILVLDEFHHILGVTGAKQRRCLNVVKTLTSELQIPIVISGIPEVLPLLRTDPQIHNRFEAATLPRWEYGMEYREFLAGLEMDLPLLEPSNLGRKSISRRVYDLSEGLIGESVKLLLRVAARAAGGSEQITLESIEASHPVPPSLRHMEAEKALRRRV